VISRLDELHSQLDQLSIELGGPKEETDIEEKEPVNVNGHVDSTENPVEETTTVDPSA